WTKPAPPLDAFLAELQDLASSPAGSRIALVIFDCKITEAALRVELVRAVRAHLTERATTLPVIFSVPTITHAQSFFDEFHAELGPREGSMIDEEDGPRAVASFFAASRLERAAYGNGITTAAGLELLGPRLIAQMDEAVAMMALGHFRFVYPWVLAGATTMRAFMRTGVSGIMTDVDDAATLTALLDGEFAAELRPAVREDDPFAERPALVLEVATANARYAGTDATVTFELTLVDGRTLRKSVDAAFNGRFERGGITTVTLPGVEVAPDQVSSITVTHDGRGLGSAWRLDSVVLRSRLGPARRACFARELTEGARVTQTFASLEP
ncbi:MAG TPA: hypothetical protein VGQ57_03940, partial [Polyangiaceae bacterium]|nr:hypothetical protein [Polyangiaceae bacterium]